jgi:hypothetical protein
MGAAVVSTQALAQPVLSLRCTADAQTPDLAIARMEWVRRCALRNLLPSDGVGIPPAMVEYYECNPTTNPWCANTFTGEWGVNYYEIMLMYLSGTTTQYLEPSGHYRWTSTRRKQRPLYAVYQNGPDINNSAQLFPHPNYATCDLYTDRYGINVAPTFYVSGYCEPNVRLLTSNVPMNNLGGTAGSAQYFALTVPAGLASVTFSMSGGTGDADLYVKYGSSPTIGSYDCRPYRAGNAETCIIPNPAAGTYYVMLRAFSTYSGVTLVGR